MTMSVLALLVALAVVVFVTIKSDEIPDSISAIAYIIPHWTFSVWIAVIGMMIMPDVIVTLPDNLQFIGFFSVVGLFFVAASSYYRTEAAPLHYIGGIMCAVCATIVSALISPLFLFVWPVYLMSMHMIAWQQWCFWAEIVVFLVLVIAINL